MPKYSINRLWILSHFDWIFANRSKIKTRPCANFIVTGFVINAFACPYYAYKIDKITLGNLIDLWDKGFIYKGFPLIHYRISHGDSSTNIAFLLRKLAPIALANFASVTRFLNSLRVAYASLLINKTSPLAVKTTGATVVFILAPSGGMCQLKTLPSRSLCRSRTLLSPLVRQI